MVTPVCGPDAPDRAWEGRILQVSVSTRQPYARARSLRRRGLIYCGPQRATAIVSSRTRTLAVSLLAVALLAWFLRGVDVGEILARAREAHPGFLLLALVAVPFGYVTRAVRWQYLLAPLGPTRFSTVMRTTVIGFAALAVLPARAGDVLRPYLLAKHEGVPASATFATVVMERVLDLVVVLALLAVFVLGFADATTLPERLLTPVEASAIAASAVAAVLVFGMWLLASYPERVGAFVAALTAVLPGRAGAGLARLATTFSGGFAASRDGRSLLMAVLWSFPIWIVISFEAWAVTRAFDIDMSVAGSFLLQGLLVIGVAVPTPGGVGSFHEAYRIGVTTFFHAPNDRAVAAAIVLHVISFVPIVVAGVVLMARDGWSLERVTAMTRATDQPGEATLR